MYVVIVFILLQYLFRPDLKFDIVVIGGGINGMVTAAYLCKFGLNVILIERSPSLGGCVKTEEKVPGYKINTYSFEQYLIHWTPIIKELGLERYGLQYYQVDPVIFSPFLDGKSSVFYRDFKKTVKNIMGISKKDARMYSKLFKQFGMVNDTIRILSQIPPPSLSDLAQIGLSHLDEFLRVILSSEKDILDEFFETDYIKVPIAFLGAAAIGLPPSQKGTGWTAGWHLMATRLARPFGGAGSLTEALTRMLREKGATVLVNSEVEKILVDRNRVIGVMIKGGKVISARIVVSAIDPKQTFLKLIPNENLDKKFLRDIQKIRVSKGITMKVDLILDRAPKYKQLYENDQAKYLGAATYIAPSIEALERAYYEYNFGINPKEPGLMVSIPTIYDSSLAPRGKHILSLETRYTPYALRKGTWEDVREEEADKIFEIFCQYCPNIRDSVRWRQIITPVDLEKDLNLPYGNFLHVDMSIEQMFSLRPLPSISHYRAPIKGLYITGAGTHPGGGVSGLPGLNTANIILDDLKIR